MIKSLTQWLASRPRQVPATTVVIHSTGGASAGSSISWLRQIGLSYHYVIERDGQVTKCVPVSRVALHAGKSLGPEGPDVNRYSIGISFANRNDGKELPTEAQELALQKLLGELVRNVPTLRYITTHRLVSWGRKDDPRGWNFLAFVEEERHGGWWIEMWRYSAMHGWDG